MPIPILNPETNINRQSNSIASRLVGFDPATILVVLNLLKEWIPQLLGCFKQSEQLSDQQVQMEAIRRHKRNPAKFERGLVSRLRKKDKSLSKLQAQAITVATIEELYSASSEQFVGCCAESPRVSEYSVSMQVAI